jgi:hypothetical protein
MKFEIHSELHTNNFSALQDMCYLKTEIEQVCNFIIDCLIYFTIHAIHKVYNITNHK